MKKMTRGIALTAIILIFAACAANAASDRVSANLRFEIPRFVHVNRSPNDDAKNDKDGKKEKDKKEDEHAEKTVNPAADILDTMNISSNCGGKIILSVDGEQTEYGFDAGGDGGNKTVEKIHSRIDGEAPESENNNDRPAEKSLAEHHEIVITVVAD